MPRVTTQVLAVGLAGLLLLLSGLIYPATVPHELHHAHHQAATHGTALCSWLCAAGQMADSAVPVVRVAFHPIAPLQSCVVADPLAALLHAPLSRAPPALAS